MRKRTMEVGRYRENVQELALHYEADPDGEPVSPATITERSLHRLRDRLDRLAQSIEKPAARRSYRYKQVR